MQGQAGGTQVGRSGLATGQIAEELLLKTICEGAEGLGGVACADGQSWPKHRRLGQRCRQQGCLPASW